MQRNILLEQLSSASPDPQRAFRNLERLLDELPGLLEKNEKQNTAIARLSSFSQFLADYCIKNPSELSLALENLQLPVTREEIISGARILCQVTAEKPPGAFRQEAMSILRRVRRQYLLRITLKDITGMSTLPECMAELSVLAEALTEAALEMAYILMTRKFGHMKGNAFAVIALGKLGAGELNYSSDIDIITLYRSELQFTTGVFTPSGMRTNKIDSHEYFCGLTGMLIDLLQAPTEEGIAYRVDMRLRPNGQKGPLALSLNSYLSYYEAWGKTWERMALVRARPVAGDPLLGRAFLNELEPFVWKRSMDYNDIEEIRDLKKRIDTISDINDIKRGYGGIREIEFFAQAFQLLYGGERKNIRTYALVDTLQELRREGFLSRTDSAFLSDVYLFLRRIEHILQMRDDLQTCSLPSGPEDLRILARKMNFPSETEFILDLKLKRLKARDMYNSLFGVSGDYRESIISLRDELPDDAMRDYLSFRGFRDPDSALKNLDALKGLASFEKTLGERSLFRKLIPLLFELLEASANRDRALGMLVRFLEKAGRHSSHLDLLSQRADVRGIIIKAFSESSYLARQLLGLENIECVFEFPDVRIDYVSFKQQLDRKLLPAGNYPAAIREHRLSGELKAGMLFLKGVIDINRFSIALTSLADTIIRAIVRYLNAEEGFAVIGFGGYGAGELNIGSDIDLIFIRRGREPSASSAGSRFKSNAPEELIRLLSGYTADGMAYRVDMRLRPDGAKGILVNTISGLRKYYLTSAQPWEIQSLLRARPVAGDRELMQEFRDMKKLVMTRRSGEIRGSDIRDMRVRIIDEVSKEASGYDLKHGPGGIKELEFLVQYLQVSNLSRYPELMFCNTVTAMKRLVRCGILDEHTAAQLLQSYRLLRTADTFLRLNEEDVLKKESGAVDVISRFLNMKSEDELFKKTDSARGMILEITRRLYG
jgi:glutamate-ammonia-ligase adenylyltransferase